MKDSYQKIWSFHLFFVPLHHQNNNSINQITSKVMKGKIEKLFGWLFIITIVLLYPVFWLDGFVHNVRRLFNKKYDKEWKEIESRLNSHLNNRGVDKTPSKEQ